MVRVLIHTVIGAMLGICLAGTAEADVIFFRPEAKIPKELLKDPITGENTKYFRYLYYPSPGMEKPLQVFMGRIHSMDRSVLNFQPVTVDPSIEIGKLPPATLNPKVGTSPFKWAKRGNKDLTIEVPRNLLIQFTSDTGGILDLRWMLSNRDVVVPWDETKGVRWGIGYPETHAYFLEAGGVPGQHLFHGKIKDRPKWTINKPIEEGWMVNVLRRGHDPAEMYVNSAVYGLLSAAARDQTYGGAFSGTTEYMYKGAGGNTKTYKFATFYRKIVRVVAHLCDQVDIPPGPQSQHAIDMGYDARDAVLRVLEAARLGVSHPGDRREAPVEHGTAVARLVNLRRYISEAVGAIGQNNKVEAEVALAKIDGLVDQVIAEGGPESTFIPSFKANSLPELKRQIAAMTGPALNTGVKPKTLSDYLPVTPTDVAMVALEVIREGSSWKIPRYDDPWDRQAKQGDYDLAIALWAREAEQRAGGRELSVTENKDLARVNGVAPGKRLVEAILDLARVATEEERKDELPRANDARRDKLDSMLLGTLVHLTKETKLVYDWKKDKVVPVSSDQRRDYFSEATRIFRRHVFDGLLEGVDSVQTAGRARRFLVQNTLSRVGYPEVNGTEGPIGGLFVFAMVPDGNREGAGLRIRQAWREEALLCLTYLAMLRGHSTDSEAEKQSKDAISKAVLRRVQGTVTYFAKGFAGSADLAFLRSFSAAGKRKHLALPPLPNDVNGDSFLEDYKMRMRQLLSANFSEMGEIRRFSEMGEIRRVMENMIETKAP